MSRYRIPDPLPGDHRRLTPEEVLRERIGLACDMLSRAVDDHLTLMPRGTQTALLTALAAVIQVREALALRR